MMTEVSPRCHVSLRVVTVRVTLQDVSPSPAANAVRAAISTEMITLRISFFVIVKIWLVARVGGNVSGNSGITGPLHYSGRAVPF